MKQGKITPNGVVLRTHENATVVFLIWKKSGRAVRQKIL